MSSGSIQFTRKASSAWTVWVIWSASEHAAASADCFWSGDGSGKLRVWTAERNCATWSCMGVTVLMAELAADLA